MICFQKNSSTNISNVHDCSFVIYINIVECLQIEFKYKECIAIFKDKLSNPRMDPHILNNMDG